MRRARGAEWRRAEALPGVTVTGEEAQVRVFPPVPLDSWPKDLAKLEGLDGEERDAQWKAWREAAERFHAAVTKDAAREDATMSRHEVEQAVKTAVGTRRAGP